jgi:uncharacterized protein (UPF0548 family)
MFRIRRPTHRGIEQFLANSAGLPLSYGPVGLVRGLDSRADVDEASATIGRGRADFERACDALRAWRQFDVGWVQLLPHDASIDVGTNVAVLIRHFGFWSLNGCRVVYHVDDSADARFGYAYGTLPTHAEAGEELFAVSLNPRTGDVLYTIRASSYARAVLARLGGPVVPMLQARFRRDSLAAMRRAMI